MSSEPCTRSIHFSCSLSGLGCRSDSTPGYIYQISYKCNIFVVGFKNRSANHCVWVCFRFTVSMEVVSAWAPAVGFTLLPHAGGILGSKITKKEIPGWYQSLQKPSWCPPNWVFAPVWGTLYTSMGYVFHIVLRHLSYLKVAYCIMLDQRTIVVFLAVCL